MPASINEFIEGLRSGTYTTALRTQDAMTWCVCGVFLEASTHQHRAEPSLQPLHVSNASQLGPRSYSSSTNLSQEARAHEEPPRTESRAEAVPPRPKGRVSPHSILSRDSSPATSCSGRTLEEDAEGAVRVQ